MKRILVGVDGSQESQAAVRTAASIARSVGAKMMLAYVVPRRPPPGPADLAPDLVRADNLEASYSAGVLREAEMSCSGIPTDSETLSGPVADTLADLATSGGYDLVVVGHRGRGGVTRVLLGSVADRLVQISPRPVLVVR